VGRYGHLSAREPDRYPSPMASSVAGKIAFVTGGASGIGAAMAAKLVEQGAEVWIADRQLGEADELAQRLGAVGGKAHAVELDVRSYPSFERAVAEAVQESGRIDYLFNNAGIGIGGEIDSFTLDDWSDIIDVNLRGVVHGIHAVYPLMIRQHSGHIVNTASMAGLVTTVGQAGYTATKHAVVALSKAMRLEAEHHGVQVSVLCPGVIRTPILTGGHYGRNTSVSDEELLKLGEALRPMAPDAFADRALRAVLRGDAIIVVPRWWKALWYLERLSPALSMRAAKVALKRTREAASAASQSESR
jgi:NADP-dependent 3-hydroxy acid dehydrogenase YdfG